MSYGSRRRARKEIPLNKVAGELNPADLMTKHLGASKIDRNVETLKMIFAEGRSNKAAQLHSLSRELAQKNWRYIKNTGHERRGGDQWVCRGGQGIWHREHSTPRLSLFTPYKVAKGPSGKTALHQKRFTCGVTESGKSFEFHDDWSLPQRRHMVMEEPWVGYTIFTDRSVSLGQAQEYRTSILKERQVLLNAGRGAWADMDSD